MESQRRPEPVAQGSNASLNWEFAEVLPLQCSEDIPAQPLRSNLQHSMTSVRRRQEVGPRRQKYTQATFAALLGSKERCCFTRLGLGLQVGLGRKQALEATLVATHCCANGSSHRRGVL